MEMYSSTEKKKGEEKVVEKDEESTGQPTVHSLLRAGDGKQTYVWSPQWCDMGTRLAFLRCPSLSTWLNLQEGGLASAMNKVVNILLPNRYLCVCDGKY